MDRFDCQYLMATFVNVYIASFIRCRFTPPEPDEWAFKYECGFPLLLFMDSLRSLPLH